jgi:probable HAF family extracellular repeat protein
MFDLGTLTGTAYGVNDSGTDINASGQIVGASSTELGNTNTFHAFLFSGAVMTDLGTLGGSASVAWGINDSGQVVGQSETSAGNARAFLYSAGVMTDLGALGGPFAQSRAQAINAVGQIVGGSGTLLGPDRPFLYSAGTMTDLGTLGGNSGEALGINDSGDVVGYSYTTPGGSPHAFLFTGGSLIDLNKLIRKRRGWVLEAAVDINERGQIAGVGRLNGDERGFLLTPRRSPSRPRTATEARDH